MQRMTVFAGVLLGVSMAVATGAQAVGGCAAIVAVLDESGGALSADEVAKKTNTDVETVRSCTDEWRKKRDAAKAPAGAAVKPGCAPIVAAIEQGGGSLSAEEVAKRTNTDVETVRSCMGGGH